MKRMSVIVFVSLIAITLTYVWTGSVAAQNKPVDDHHKAKIFNFTNVNGSGRDKAEAEVNAWLADKNNKAAEPMVLFCYNAPAGTLLVTVIWKNDAVTKPYQVRFFPITATNRDSKKEKNKKKKSLEEELNEFFAGVTLKRVWQETSDGVGMIFVVYQK